MEEVIPTSKDSGIGTGIGMELILERVGGHLLMLTRIVYLPVLAMFLTNCCCFLNCRQGEAAPVIVGCDVLSMLDEIETADVSIAFTSGKDTISMADSYWDTAGCCTTHVFVNRRSNDYIGRDVVLHCIINHQTNLHDYQIDTFRIEELTGYRFGIYVASEISALQEASQLWDKTRSNDQLFKAIPLSLSSVRNDAALFVLKQTHSTAYQ